MTKKKESFIALLPIAVGTMMLMVTCVLLSFALVQRADVLVTELNKPPGTITQQVRVDARQRWQVVAEGVKKGEQIEIEYVKGTWSAWGGPKQQADGTGFANEYRDNVPVPNAPVGALVGQIGESQPFYVGNHLALTASEDGSLFLGINDEWLNDNSGALVVHVVVKSVSRKWLH